MINKFMFSAEEINLMCIFDISSKENLLSDLCESLKDIYDLEMREIYESTIEKLGDMGNEEYTSIDFYPANEFDEYEN